MSSHCLKGFGDGDARIHLTLGNFRGSCQIAQMIFQRHFRHTSYILFQKQEFALALPMSVCLVTGGVTVADLKAGPATRDIPMNCNIQTNVVLILSCVVMTWSVF